MKKSLIIMMLVYFTFAGVLFAGEGISFNNGKLTSKSATSTKKISKTPEFSQDRGSKKILFEQTAIEPDEVDWWSIGVSDMGYQEIGDGLIHADNFSVAEGIITNVKVIGLNLFNGDDWSEADEDPMNFIVNFYEDNNGTAGELVSHQEINGISRVANGNDYLGFIAYEWDIPLETPVNMQSGWIAVAGNNNDTEGWFMWANSAEGDNVEYINYNDSDGWQLSEDEGRPTDRAFTLTGDFVNTDELIISEVKSNGDASYIEFYNNTDKDLDLESVKVKYFNNGSSEASETNLSGNLETGEYYVITRNQNAFTIAYPGKTVNAIFSAMLLDGGKDALALVCNNQVIDRFNAEGAEAETWDNGDHFVRTDILSSGESLANDWAKTNENSTPGETNQADSGSESNWEPDTNVDFGSNGTDQPAVVLNMNNGNLPGATTVEIKRGKDVPNAGEETFVKRYAKINSENQPSDASLRIYYKDSELNGLDENKLIIVGYWDGSWHEFNNVNRNADENWVETTGINHFSNWALREGKDGNLPVQLSSFAAIQTSDNCAEIEWVTQTENDMRGYYVYRGYSENITESNKLNPEIIPAHNSPTAVKYSYKDETVNPGETYWFWLESAGNDGVVKTFGPLIFTLENQEDVNPADIPDVSYLNNSYPNPFNISKERNGEVSIRFGVKENDEADLTVYNLKGQLVKEFKSYKPGNHTVNWNLKTENGKNAESGIYFYRLKTKTTDITHKMLIIK